jgi:hypothetical protein
MTQPGFNPGNQQHRALKVTDSEDEDEFEDDYD